MPGSISSAGIGSGLKVEDIITSLLNVEKQPLSKLQTTATAMQTRLSAFGQMQSLVSTFRDAAAKLDQASAYAVTKAGSSDAASVAASSTDKAVPGSYSVAVTALSSTQSTVSTAGQFAASTSLVGTGSISIRLGTWAAGQTAFTAKSGSQDIVIPIGASESSLGAIRDKINAAAAGVSATLITDSTGSRLALQSTKTGAENGFKVSIIDADGTNNDNTGLSRLGFDPTAGAAQTTLTQSAANAQATINGIAVTTAGNTLTDVVDGITFTLNKVTIAPAIITVASDTGAIKAMLDKFVEAYNGLSSFLASATRYDPSTKSGALLQGDALTTGLQTQLRALVGQPGSASTQYATLSRIGLEFQKDGSLKLDTVKSSAALANLPELTLAMSNVNVSNPANNGFAKKLADWADGLLASDGRLPGKTKSIQSQIVSNQKDQARFNDKLAQIEARLRKQYTTLDATMSKANSLSQYVSQQITTWNKSGA